MKNDVKERIDCSYSCNQATIIPASRLYDDECGVIKYKGNKIVTFCIGCLVVVPRRLLLKIAEGYGDINIKASEKEQEEIRINRETRAKERIKLLEREWSDALIERVP